MVCIMLKLISFLDKKFEPILIVTAISLMTAIIIGQIILRLFGTSFIWAEELARYLFVWAIYLSISYAIRDDRHIRITVLVDAMPPPLRLLSLVFADIIFMIYSSAILYFGIRVLNRSIELGQIAPALEVPVAILYSSVVVCAALSIIRLAVSIKKRCSAKQSRHPLKESKL